LGDNGDDICDFADIDNWYDGTTMKILTRINVPCAPFLVLASVLVMVLAHPDRSGAQDTPLSISGRYPHLAMFNHQGECGTGAVAPWADRLWVITYGPHLPHGSDDKLYEIDAQLHRITRPESVGGTPADRLIHRESDQLIIGPYFIDAMRNVRVVTPKQMPGRLTAAARHLSDPANKVYIHDMEGTLYEVDVHTLAVTKLFDNVAPGAHAKGAYSGQGVLVVANNGDEPSNKAPLALVDPDYKRDRESAGALAEWNGKEWAMVLRRAFTDVTGPGGIEGAPADNAPLWSIGWDKRSVLLAVRDAGKWQIFRLPIADFSYVASHGWYTEWPRIREVGNGKFLMNIHGGWYDFPKTFSASSAAGLRPIGSYLKITGDFAPWNGRIVFGCDDASIMANPLLGQSQSNLWFGTWDNLHTCGRSGGSGAVLLNDALAAGTPSAPYLFAGYSQRVVHLAHFSAEPVTFTLEIDADGKGSWKPYQSITVPPYGRVWHIVPPATAGEWIRVKSDRDVRNATVYFTYGPGGGTVEEKSLFSALIGLGEKGAASAGAIRPLGGDRGTLWFDAQITSADGQIANQVLEVAADLQFHAYPGPPPVMPKPDPHAPHEYKIEMDDASIVIADGPRRYRLPFGAGLASDWQSSARTLRECVTERYLLNTGGSFFMVPRPTAGGPQRMKPICTHAKRIADFCSWRGLMVLSGCRADSKPDGHYFSSGSGAGLWFGDIDDLWKMGKPVGHGGPWLRSSVKANEPSDPYLMDGYDRKTLELSHDAPAVVTFTLEVDVAANGGWLPLRTFTVAAGQTVKYAFPEGYCAHWLRLRADAACKATAKLHYE
jgi:hypothetical protein